MLYNAVAILRIGRLAFPFHCQAAHCCAAPSRHNSTHCFALATHIIAFPLLCCSENRLAFATDFTTTPFLCFAILRLSRLGKSIPFPSRLFPCTSVLCASELSYAIALLTVCGSSYAISCVSMQFLCCARPRRAKPRHRYLFNLFPSEATFTGVSPLTDTTKGAVVEPFSYGRLKVFVEKDDFKCD